MVVRFRRSRRLGLKHLRNGSPEADPCRNTDERRHNEHGSEHRGDQPEHWRQATQVMGRDLEQTDAEWEAEDRAGQGGDDLRHGQPGSDLLGCCTQRQRHCGGASRVEDRRQGGEDRHRGGRICERLSVSLNLYGAVPRTPWQPWPS
jgi:hypothetical protein